MTDLQRPDLPRRLRWHRLVIPLVIAAQAVAVYALVAKPEPEPSRIVTTIERTQTTQVVTIPAPVIVEVPAAPTIAQPVERASCPPPRTDAPTFTPPRLPEAVTGLAVSPTNAGWIAAWNDQHIFASSDAGKTFTRILDGAGPVRAVQFDCFGHAIAVRGNKVGIKAATETWRPVTVSTMDESRLSIIGGGRDVIVIGDEDEARSRVAISSDRAQSWRYHSLETFGAVGGSGFQGFQRADGSVVVSAIIADCMSDDIMWADISARGEIKTRMFGVPSGGYSLHDGYVYATSSRIKMNAPDDAEWETYKVSDEWYGMPIQAPYPVFVSDGVATRIEGKTPVHLPVVVVGEKIAMDPAGRIWSIVCGQLAIATKASALRSCDQSA